MNLSDFIRYRNQLEAMTVNSAESAADIELRKIIDIVKLCPVPFLEQLDELGKNHHELHKVFGKFESKLQELKDKVNNIIAEQSEPWIDRKSTRLNSSHT